MMSIEKYSKIKKDLLSGEFYFQSLLQAGHNEGELGDLEMEGIQMQCIKLLADNVERYNKGESSSVRVETAQTIMESNLYTIGIYLKSLPDIASALETVKKEPLSKLYQQSRKIINAKLNAAKHLYHLVRKTKTDTPNYTYNATIEEGIESFFKHYNADFEAHEIPASIDYQLMIPIRDLTGVEFMIQYLQNLYVENLFCSKFDAAVIHEVMGGYDEAYKDLLVNIFGQVLQNSLGCAALNKDILPLSLAPSDIRELERALKDETKASIQAILQQKGDMVIEALAIGNSSLKTYIHASLPELASRIHFAINNNTLQTIFIPRYTPSTNQTIKYSMGKKMDDEAYRNIVNEVLACRYSDDKIQIIKEHIRTLYDMEDMIMDGELTETEALALFSLLDDVEIAVLVKRHPYRREVNAIDSSEGEIKLRNYLDKYVKFMAGDRLKQFQKTLSNITFQDV